MTEIALLLFFLLDGVLEGWRWSGNEPLSPDYFHPTIGIRNGLAVVAGLLGGLTIPHAIGVCLIGGLVLREGALNLITRGVLFPDEKQSLLGIPRHPAVEAFAATLVGVPLLFL